MGKIIKTIYIVISLWSILILLFCSSVLWHEYVDSHTETTAQETIVVENSTSSNP